MLILGNTSHSFAGRSPLRPPATRFQSQDFPSSPAGSGQWVPSALAAGLSPTGVSGNAPVLKRHRTEPGRPTSYLPGVRSFTPLALSMPFVGEGGSSSPRHGVGSSGAEDAEVIQRPGMPSMPSSDLLPERQSEGEEQHDPFYSSEDLHADNEIPTSYASSADAQAFSHPMKSKYNPRYLSYSAAHYPSNQPYPSQPFFTGSEEAAYRPSHQHRLSHLRNRSSGTVLTTSSSATTRIRPVFFGDSPSSSIADSSSGAGGRYQPSEPYLEELRHHAASARADVSAASSSGSGSGSRTGSRKSRSISGNKASKGKHRLSASYPVEQAGASSIIPHESSGTRQFSNESITSLAKGFVFPAPPPAFRRSSTAPSATGFAREQLKTVPSGRRSSGKLPDSWFGGPAVGEGGKKRKSRTTSQAATVLIYEDEDGLEVDRYPDNEEEKDAARASTQSQTISPTEDGSPETARPESELLASADHERYRPPSVSDLPTLEREYMESLQPAPRTDGQQHQKGILLQQPSFTSLASTSDTGNISNTSQYGHAM